MVFEVLESSFVMLIILEISCNCCFSMEISVFSSKTSAFNIGRKACLVGSFFSGYLAYGIGLWIGLQALINIGVNAGILPTKGITLPLMSKGGSSILITCMAVGLLFRIDYENKLVFNRKNKCIR